MHGIRELFHCLIERPSDLAKLWHLQRTVRSVQITPMELRLVRRVRRVPLYISLPFWFLSKFTQKTKASSESTWFKRTHVSNIVALSNKVAKTRSTFFMSLLVLESQPSQRLTGPLRLFRMLRHQAIELTTCGEQNITKSYKINQHVDSEFHVDSHEIHLERWNTPEQAFPSC